MSTDRLKANHMVMTRKRSIMVIKLSPSTSTPPMFAPAAFLISTCFRRSSPHTDCSGYTLSLISALLWAGSRVIMAGCYQSWQTFYRILGITLFSAYILDGVDGQCFVNRHLATRPSKNLEYCVMLELVVLGDQYFTRRSLSQPTKSPTLITNYADSNFGGIHHHSHAMVSSVPTMDSSSSRPRPVNSHNNNNNQQHILFRYYTMTLS